MHDNVVTNEVNIVKKVNKCENNAFQARN